MGEVRKKPSWRKIIGTILFVALVLSIVFAIYKVFTAPSDPAEAMEHGRLKSDYLLMLLQCVLALIVMFIPSLILEKKLKIRVPNYIFVLYFIFLFCAVYLGEVRNFYFVVPHWDTMLHAFSGAMLGALGFSLVSMLNSSKNVAVNLSPAFVGLFAFCFALAAGAVWEIYEFTLDSILNLNMQKAYTESGVALVGREALLDTMKDTVVDAIGAFIMALIGTITMKKNSKVKKTE
ncbi:MAG: hypothetical protein RR232_05575 [Clostridia bacterium]